MLSFLLSICQTDVFSLKADSIDFLTSSTQSAWLPYSTQGDLKHLQELCKIYFMQYKQEKNPAPTFLVYPKRKSSKDSVANMYMQFCYQLGKIDKSLGLRIDFNQWDPIDHIIKDQ